MGWTLTVNTTAFANVTITDSTGTQVFSGQADGSGRTSALLDQYLQTPGGRTYTTPHTVTVELGGQGDSTQVTMNATKSITLYPPGYAPSGSAGDSPLLALPFPGLELGGADDLAVLLNVPASVPQPQAS